MGFEVDNKKHKDLWDKQIQHENAETKQIIVKPDKRERSKHKQRISFVVSVIALLVVLSVPFAIGTYKRWQEDKYEKEHDNDPSMLQNRMYTNAFCTNVVYPKDVEYVSYTAQSYVKPYELTIHVNGSASSMSEYYMTSEMAFNVFKDLGTVKIVEDETEKEYVFKNDK